MCYIVIFEDKNWYCIYVINIYYLEIKSILMVFNFENVKIVFYNKNEYYVLYEVVFGYFILIWFSGN